MTPEVIAATNSTAITIGSSRRKTAEYLKTEQWFSEQQIMLPFLRT